jgi:hypothetical protein
MVVCRVVVHEPFYVCSGEKIWGFGRKKEMSTTTKANPINHGPI